MNRHVEALAEEFLSRSHDVRVFAPLDPPGRASRLLHRAAPEAGELPAYLTPLGRTVGFGANGSVSNLAPFPFGGFLAPRRAVREAKFDVVHVHEPLVPLVGWNATLAARAPVVGTFHAYSTKPVPNHLAAALGARRLFNRLSARIAVSEAAAWTGRRWFGGDYTIVPNGVDVGAVPSAPATPSGELRILFVGRPEERKGLPILLAAFGGLVEHGPCRLTLIGAEREDVLRYLADPELLRWIDVRGRVSGAELWAELHAADVLCAPSLAGESFGMVLTEAFAAGTPVVASNIAGYSDVVTDGVDGLLVPPGDPQRLAEELQRVQHEPSRLREMGEAARRSAQRYAWPRVADQVTAVYERAIEAPRPEGASQRLIHWAGLRPADGGPRRPPRKLPSLDPAPARAGGRGRDFARRAGLAVAAALGLGLTALATQKIGVDKVVESIVRSNLTLVLVACALMGLSLFCRAASWYWIARAALPNRPVRRRDVTSATMIGVLMSATLPARLGEPARALTLARRTGRMRETFPVLLGTLVSQTLLNLVALALLGVIIVSTTPLFHSGTQKLFVFSLVPLVSAGRDSRRADADAPQRQRPPRPPRRRSAPGAAPGAGRSRRVPRPAPRLPRRRRPARRLGDPAGRLLGPALRARAGRQGGDRGGRRGPLRGQRHRGRARDSLQHRRLPARGDQRPAHGLRCRHRRRPCLRRHPPGRRDRHGGRPRAARPRPRGPDLARPAHPGHLSCPGAAPAAAVRTAGFLTSTWLFP